MSYLVYVEPLLCDIRLGMFYMCDCAAMRGECESSWACLCSYDGDQWGLGCQYLCSYRGYAAENSPALCMLSLCGDIRLGLFYIFASSESKGAISCLSGAL